MKSERTAPLHPNSIRHIKKMSKMKKIKGVLPPSAALGAARSTCTEVERAVGKAKTEQVTLEVSGDSQKVEKITEPLKITEGHERSKRRLCQCSKYYPVNLFA